MGVGTVTLKIGIHQLNHILIPKLLKDRTSFVPSRTSQALPGFEK